MIRIKICLFFLLCLSQPSISLSSVSCTKFFPVQSSVAQLHQQQAQNPNKDFPFVDQWTFENEHFHCGISCVVNSSQTLRHMLGLSLNPDPVEYFKDLRKQYPGYSVANKELGTGVTLGSNRLDIFQMLSAGVDSVNSDTKRGLGSKTASFQASFLGDGDKPEAQSLGLGPDKINFVSSFKVEDLQTLLNQDNKLSLLSYKIFHNGRIRGGHIVLVREIRTDGSLVLVDSYLPGTFIEDSDNLPAELIPVESSAIRQMKRGITNTSVTGTVEFTDPAEPGSAFYLDAVYTITID